MKRFLSFFSLLLLAVTAIAQSPKLSYQAVVRDSQNKLVIEQFVTVQVDILDANNNNKFQQKLSAKTNRNGLLSLEIGEETDNWKTIEWKGAKIRTAIKWEGGTVVVDTTFVNAVPMALYASKVSDEALSNYLDSATVISSLQDSLAVRDSTIQKMKKVIVELNEKINQIITYISYKHENQLVTDGIIGSSGNSGNSYKCGDTLVTDAQGNSYRTVELYDNTKYTCWMAENLRTRTGGAGDYGYPKGCLTKEDSLRAGRLYSWEEATDHYSLSGNGIRGICPEGWHIPSRSECPDLMFFNDKSFNAFPAGLYNGSSYQDYNLKAYFWTSTIAINRDHASTSFAWEIFTGSNTNSHPTTLGLSVRCIKDNYSHLGDYEQIKYDQPTKPILPGVGPIAF